MLLAYFGRTPRRRPLRSRDRHFEPDRRACAGSMSCPLASWQFVCLVPVRSFRFYPNGYPTAASPPRCCEMHSMLSASKQGSCRSRRSCRKILLRHTVCHDMKSNPYGPAVFQGIFRCRLEKERTSRRVQCLENLARKVAIVEVGLDEPQLHCNARRQCSLSSRLTSIRRRGRTGKRINRISWCKKRCRCEWE